MPRRRPDRVISDDFVKALEEGIRAILKDPKATPTQLSQAVAAGVKLESLKHQLKDTDDDSPGSFFRRDQ